MKACQSRGAATARPTYLVTTPLEIPSALAVYAEQILGFKQADTMLRVFMVNIAAVAGAFAFGYWQDRVGYKRSLGFTLVGWMLMTLLAALATGPAMFWVAAVIAGLCMGSSQSAGRAMVGLLTPPDRKAEFFEPCLSG